jgi:hypothetical protein
VTQQPPRELGSSETGTEGMVILSYGASKDLPRWLRVKRREFFGWRVTGLEWVMGSF